MDLYNRINQTAEHFDELCTMIMRDDPMLTELQIARLTSTRLSYEIGDVDAGKLGICLRGNTKLKYLTIALDPRLTGIGAKTLASSIRQSKLRSVGIQNFSGADSSLMTILFEGVAQSQSIQELQVWGEVGDFSALSHAIASLRALHLMSCWDFSTGVQTLSEGLKQTNSLETLVMDSCGITKEELKVLTVGLRRNTSVKTFNVDSNLICNEGMKSFVENWSEDSPIEELCFSCNIFDIDGLLALMQAVPRHSLVKAIDISGNQFSYDDLRTVAELLPRLRLRSLGMNSCAPVTDEHECDEADFTDEAVLAGKALLEGIRQNFHLKDNPPKYELFPEHINREIEHYYDLNRCGRQLLGHEGVAPGLWSHVLARCGNRIGAVYHFLREKPDLMLSNGRLCKKRRLGN